MATIILETKIKAPRERCFLLSLSVDLHKASTSGTNEEAVAGVTKGLMTLNDTVTWRARHFGITQYLTTKISEYRAPGFFVSEMLKGPFKKMHHQHIFISEDEQTLMKDIFELQAPFGIFGEMAEKIFLVNYMSKFLVLRNECIKRIAETGEWKNYLPKDS